MVALSLGELLGRGFRCDVYAWGEGQVVKLFQPDARRGWIEDEAARSRLVHEAGLPTPWVGDIIQVEGKTGIVYERLDGPALDDVVMTHLDDIASLGRKFAELHASIHVDSFIHHATSPQQKAAIARCVPIGRDAYIERYLERRPGSREEIEAWMLPLYAVRLTENIPGLQDALLSTLRELAARL